MDKPNSWGLQAELTLPGAEALNESEVRYRLLFENSFDGIVMVDNLGVP